MTIERAPAWAAPKGWSRTLTPKLLVLNLGVAAAYALTGYLGLRLAFVAHAVTLFWPPSGIAFAVIWLGGYRFAPGVTLGAFAVNLIVLGAPDLAAVVAVGNTLPALASRFLLLRLRGAGGGARELVNVLSFILVPVLAATMLSATVGAVTLGLSGRITTQGAPAAWVLWWLGDAMGVLIIAPPIVLARRWSGYPSRPAAVAEAVGFGLAGAAVLVALGLLRGPPWATEICKLLTLILSLGAGARFRLQGASVMVLMMALGATYATYLGVGPFVRGSFYDSFALLHSYLFAQGVTAFIIAAALDDLRRSLAQEKAARLKVEAAAAARARLFNMVSHDLRTPVNAVMGVLQILDAAPLPAAQARLTGLALRASHTLTTLISDILDVARTDAGLILLRDEPFDPARSLRDLVELNRASALAKGLSLELEGGDDLPPRVTGDISRFEQLMGNLVTNAIAYTGTGGVVVAARWRATDIRPLVIDVIDTGPGLDDGVLAGALGAPGSDIPGKYGGRSAGLGLGLYICRRLTDLMDGTLDYRRTDDGQSVFRVELNLAEAAAPTTGGARPVERPGANLHILLVEDDPISQEVTATLLKSIGYSVELADDPDTAVRLAANQRFDAILMDEHLRGGSGADATRRIRALGGAAAEATIIAVTADAARDSRARYLAAGADAVLAKPLMINEDFYDALALSQSGRGRADRS